MCYTLSEYSVSLMERDTAHHTKMKSRNTNRSDPWAPGTPLVIVTEMVVLEGPNVWTSSSDK